MSKDYYKILEIDRDASEEIIEKVYKILAKKYHPDLQRGENQKAYEEKLKEINEAYEVLSNSYKKSVYDEELKKTTISQEEIQSIINENRILRQQLQQIQRPIYQERVNRVEQVRNNANPQANYTREVVYRKSFKQVIKDYLKLAGIILALILVLILLYQIPFVKNWFREIYNENIAIKIIVDSLVQTFKTSF